MPNPLLATPAAAIAAAPSTGAPDAYWPCQDQPCAQCQQRYGEDDPNVGRQGAPFGEHEAHDGEGDTGAPCGLGVRDLGQHTEKYAVGGDV